MRSTNCFINVNEIANEYPDIRLKKITGITFDKSKESILSYREQLKEKGYIYFRYKRSILCDKSPVAIFLKNRCWVQRTSSTGIF